MTEIELEQIQRFLKYVKIVGSCWEWQGFLNDAGYGNFRFKRKNWLAHRFAYSIFTDDLDPKLILDHLCKNTKCCNPKHLEQVTQKENLERAPKCITTIKRNKTHCKRGHPFSGDNLYVYPNEKRNQRGCRICMRMAARLHYTKIKRKEQ